MSFGYLPWQLYVLLACIVGIGLIIYVKKVSAEHQKVYLIGIMLIGIGAILSGLYKLLYQFNLNGALMKIILLLAMVCGLPGIALTMIGSYNKVKSNPQKKKAILILFFTSLIVVLICGFVVILAYCS